MIPVQIICQSPHFQVTIYATLCMEFGKRAFGADFLMRAISAKRKSNINRKTTRLISVFGASWVRPNGPETKAHKNRKPAWFYTKHAKHVLDKAQRMHVSTSDDGDVCTCCFRNEWLAAQPSTTLDAPPPIKDSVSQALSPRTGATSWVDEEEETVVATCGKSAVFFQTVLIKIWPKLGQRSAGSQRCVFCRATEWLGDCSIAIVRYPGASDPRGSAGGQLRTQHGNKPNSYYIVA